MYKLRAREYHGKNEENFGLLHTFSFGQYFDSFNLGFSDLLAFNDSRYTKNGTLKIPTCLNIEVVTFVIDGESTFEGFFDEDILLKSGDVQVMSCASDIAQNEQNRSLESSAQFAQIWILPYKKNVHSVCKKKNFSQKSVKNKLKPVVSSDGRSGSLKINQDINIYKSMIETDKVLYYRMSEDRKFWIQVINGAIDVNSNILESGDGISIVGESGLLEIVGVDNLSEFLLLDLRALSL